MSPVCKHCNKKLLDHKSGAIPYCPVGKKDRGFYFQFSPSQYYEEKRA